MPKRREGFSPSSRRPNSEKRQKPTTLPKQKRENFSLRSSRPNSEKHQKLTTLSQQKRENFSLRSRRPNSEKSQKLTTLPKQKRDNFSLRGSRPINKNISALALFLFFSIPTHAQTPWYENFFLEGSFHLYFVPDEIGEVIKPEPGYRGAFGYEFKNFRFALESGFTQITGTNPLVLDITIVPLAFKFGYNLPIIFGFGVQADLGLGYFFSHTTRYETAIDLVMGNLREDDERSLFIPARLYLTWSPWRFLKIYAGGGIDLVFETEGPIPMPLAEIGISLKPLALIGSVARGRQNRQERQEQQARQETVNALYYVPNSAEMIEGSSEFLDEAGQRLADDPTLRVTLRAYFAPPGGALWQVQRGSGEPALSAARAEACAQYFVRKYGIAPERIKIEYQLAESPELYSCVELITR